MHSKDGSVTDQHIYMRDFKWLVRSDSREEYLDRQQDVRRQWDEMYLEYYMKSVDPEVEKLAVWKLREWGMPITTGSTITSNQ